MATTSKSWLGEAPKCQSGVLPSVHLFLKSFMLLFLTFFFIFCHISILYNQQEATWHCG